MIQQLTLFSFVANELRQENTDPAKRRQSLANGTANGKAP